MPDHIVGKLYAVFSRDEENPDDPPVLMTTEDMQEAITYAKEHKGVVYMYDDDFWVDVLHAKQ